MTFSMAITWHSHISSCFSEVSQKFLIFGTIRCQSPAAIAIRVPGDEANANFARTSPEKVPDIAPGGFEHLGTNQAFRENMGTSFSSWTSVSSDKCPNCLCYPTSYIYIYSWLFISIVHGSIANSSGSSMWITGLRMDPRWDDVGCEAPHGHSTLFFAKQLCETVPQGAVCRPMLLHLKQATNHGVIIRWRHQSVGYGKH